MSEQKGKEFAAALKLFEQALMEVSKKAYNEGYNAAMELIRSVSDGPAKARGARAKPASTGGTISSSWPVLEGNTLSYKGKTLKLQNSRYILLLQKLLEANGGSLSTQELVVIYGGKKSALRSAIARLRKMLKAQMPQIGIATDFSSSSYRIVLNKPRRRK